MTYSLFYGKRWRPGYPGPLKPAQIFSNFCTMCYSAMMKDLSDSIHNVLAGKSVNSEAKLAGVNPTTLRRLVMKHPDYVDAKAKGLLHKPGLPGYVPLDPDKVEAAISAITRDGLTVEAAALLHGMAVSTVNKEFRRRYPDSQLKRGGLGVKRDPESKLQRARAAVDLARAALARAEAELGALISTQGQPK